MGHLAKAMAHERLKDWKNWFVYLLTADEGRRALHSKPTLHSTPSEGYVLLATTLTASILNLYVIEIIQHSTTFIVDKYFLKHFEI